MDPSKYKLKYETGCLYLLEALKERVLLANQSLPKHGLVLFTWGNVSAIDRAQNLVVIKPSGVSYDNMDKSDMVVVDLDGNVVEGKLKPSSDLLTHLEIYKNFENVQGIVHTHSSWCTSWAQASRNIPAFGTTHADYFYGEILCTRSLLDSEIQKDYELNTGKVIVETMRDKDPLSFPGVIVDKHGPFNWGISPEHAVENAVVMEEVAKLAFNTCMLQPKVDNMEKTLLDKHFLRKHGKNAYYGQ